MGQSLAMDGSVGRIAVLNYYNDNPWNDPAFVNPAANLGLFKFHSGLRYLGSNQVLTGTIDLKNPLLGGWTASGNGYVKALATHGRGFAPIIMGFFTISGKRVPINGTSLLTGVGTVSGAPSLIAINAYADNANVNLRMDSIFQGYLANSTVIGFTLWICNMGDNGSGLVLPTFFNGVDLTPNQFKAGYFDPQTYGYFYRDPAGQITAYKDRSLSVDVGAYPPSPSTFFLGCRQDIGGYSCSLLTCNPAFDLGAWNRAWPGTPVLTPNVEHISVTAPGAAGLIAEPGFVELGTGFNTNQNTLLISDYIPQSLTIPQFSAVGGGGIYRTDVFNLGACHPNASLVLGTFTIGGETYSIGGTNFARFSTMRMGPSQSYDTNPSGLNLSAAGQTFYLQASGGVISCIVRSFIPRSVAANLVATTISFRALAATFDY